MSGRDEWLLLSAVLKELLAGHALAHPEPGTKSELLVLVGTVEVARTVRRRWKINM